MLLCSPNAIHIINASDKNTTKNKVNLLIFRTQGNYWQKDKKVLL